MPFLDPQKFDRVTRMNKQGQSKSVPTAKGPYEKTGGIPIEKLTGFMAKGPFSIPWSKNKKKSELKQMAKEVSKKRLSFYGRNISGAEIKSAVSKMRKVSAKTGAEKSVLKEQIVRLEEAQKRAGL